MMDKGKYFDSIDAANAPHYPLPMEMFAQDSPYKRLPLMAKVIYAVLRSRINLSMLPQNRAKFTDKAGRIFCHYPQTGPNSLAELLGSDKPVDGKTIRKALDALKEAGLIEIKRQGNRKTDRIYLKKMSPILTGKNSPSEKSLIGKNSPSMIGKISPQYNRSLDNRKQQQIEAGAVADAPLPVVVPQTDSDSDPRTSQPSTPATAQSAQLRSVAPPSGVLHRSDKDTKMKKEDGCPPRPASVSASCGSDTASSTTEPRPAAQLAPSNAPHSRMAADNDAEAKMVAAVLISEFHAAPRVVAGWLKRYDLDRIKRNANYTVNLVTPPDDPVKYLSAAIRDDYAASRTATETQAAADLAAIEEAGRALQAALAADC